MFLVRLAGRILSAIWSALQPAFRFLGWLSLLLAVITFVIDFTRWQLGMPGDAMTPLSSYLTGFAPGSLAAIQTLVSRAISPIVWDPIITGFLGWAPWISLTVLGVLLSWLGRRRERLHVFAN
ncbi:MAG: hypothetical protein AAGC70_11795 [Pseudomonadota bacterium]